ncbi:MAG: hypothetical protein P3W87_002955 [Gammaproteobacteria bacterium]|nr:hypothetical protein [Gammaproteobacteria bacterium]
MIYGKNSSMKMTALLDNIANLEIDTDGNGSFEATRQVGSGEVFSLYCGS